MDATHVIPNPTDGPAQFFDWLVAFNSPSKISRDNLFSLWVELLAVVFFFIVCGSAAVEHGPKHLNYIFAEFLAAFTLEMFPIMSSDYDLWWYFPGMISVFGRRFPLSLFFLYVEYGYVSWSLAQQSKLPIFAEVPVVGFYSLLIMLPVEILASKHLFWTWHTNDIFTRERVYGLSYLELTCISSKVAFNARAFRILWKNFVEHRDQKYRWYRGVICSILSAVIGLFSTGTCYFLLFYILHMQIGLSQSVILALYVLVYVLFAWRYLGPRDNQIPIGWTKVVQGSVMIILTTLYLLIAVSVIFVRPENVRAEGLHQPLGPCNSTKSANIFGMLTVQRGYLCASDYIYERPRLGEFDFHCLTEEERTKLLNSTGQWYTICGLPIENRLDFCFTMFTLCFLGMWFGTRAYRYSLVDNPPKPTLAVLSTSVRSFILHRGSKSQQISLTEVDKI